MSAGCYRGASSQGNSSFPHGWSARHARQVNTAPASRSRIPEVALPDRFTFTRRYGLQLTFCDVEAEPSTVMSG
jgi:hypothetical protein